MNLKKHLNKKITLTILQRQSIIIITLLSTLLLLSLWPRFLNDATSFPVPAYIILIIISSIPLFKNS